MKLSPEEASLLIEHHFSRVKQLMQSTGIISSEIIKDCNRILEIQTEQDNRSETK